MTIGLPESSLAEMISDVEDSLPSHIKVAYLPNFGMVRLRLSGIGGDEKELNTEIESFAQRILKIVDPKYIGATEDIRPEQIIGKLLTEKKQTLSTAESCTGGYISHLITSIPGSSNYFTGSLIAYSNHIKINHLGVRAHTIKNFGAVSEECVKEMAAGIKAHFQTDFSVSTTGIAGPDGATPEKPVGLVWLAVAGPLGIVTRKIMANGERLSVIERTTIVAFDMLRKAILGISS